LLWLESLYQLRHRLLLQPVSNDLARQPGYNYYTNDYYDAYSGYTGNFSTTFALSNAALTDLGADGLLSFFVRATAGDFLISGITLSATLGDAPGGQGQGVPEPASLALLGLGAVALGMSRKRKAKKS
jgi:hypothetical protein